eukprot:gene40387-25221_t
MAIGVLTLVVLICYRKRINFSAAIIEQGCRGLQHNFSLVTVVSPLLLLITLAWLAWWFFTMVYLFSVKGDKVSCDQYNTDEVDCQLYGCHYEPGPPGRDSNPLNIGNSLKGVGWAFSYHLGTIAKGSFVIAVIKFITWLLEMEQKQETNKFVKCFLCVLTCCCRCIEQMVKFVTRFAY